MRYKAKRVIKREIMPSKGKIVEQKRKLWGKREIMGQKEKIMSSKRVMKQNGKLKPESPPPHYGKANRTTNFITENHCNVKKSTNILTRKFKYAP